MKIEVNNKGPRNYYNEIAYIKLNFSRVLYNPVKPAKTETAYVLTRAIGFLAVLPKEISMYGIYCSLEYKDEMVRAIKEAGHSYMIEDNVTVQK